MRASHLQSNVAALDDLGAVWARRVRDAVPDEVLREIEESVRVAWLPLELDEALTGAVERVCGRDRMRRWSRDAIARSAEGPLLGPIMGALTRIGLTPHLALGRVPRGWGLVYRHCGHLRYERTGETSGELVHEDVPDLVLHNRPYLEGIGGSMDGIMELSGGPQPHAEVVVEPDARRVRYRCRW